LSKKQKTNTVVVLQRNTEDIVEDAHVQVLAIRIGDIGSAHVVSLLAQAAEAWMSGLQSHLISPFRSAACQLPERYKGFSGSRRPRIALDRYLGRLVHYLDTYSEEPAGVSSFGVRALVVGATYVDRLGSSFGFDLNPMNCHRVLMVCTLLASKMVDDEPCSNEYFSNVGGVTLQEINHLEVTLLKALDWNASVQLEDVRQSFAKFVPTYRFLEEPAMLPAI